jgi:hypothetical protein
VESGGIAASRRALAIVPSSSLPPARKEAKLAALRIIELLIHLVLPHTNGPPRLQPAWPNTATLAHPVVSAPHQILVIRYPRQRAQGGLSDRRLTAAGRTRRS